MTTRVAVVGATGSLGQLAARLIEESSEYELFATLNSHSSLDDMVGADLVFEATLPSVSRSIVEFATSHGINTVVGTSGWSNDRVAELRKSLEGSRVGVVIVPNFSTGSVVATALATVAAHFFDSIEIVETHGEKKVDSPSGTAIRTAELIASYRGERGPVIAPHADQRARGAHIAGVPVHSLRMSGSATRQRVLFGGIGEAVTIDHETVSQGAYEAGIALALDATRAANGVTVGLDSLINIRSVFASLAQGDESVATLSAPGSDPIVEATSTGSPTQSAGS